MIVVKWIWAVGYLLLLLTGWWLPAALYYGYGLRAVLRAKQWPRRAIWWTAIFTLSLAYTSYKGAYLRWRFDQHAEIFKDLVTYADPPSDIRTIVISAGGSGNGIVDRSQQCNFNCAALLLSG